MGRLRRGIPGQDAERYSSLWGLLDFKQWVLSFDAWHVKDGHYGLPCLT